MTLDWQERMRVRLDVNNMMAHAVPGGGIEQEELAASAPACARALTAMERKRADMAWRALPFASAGEVEEIEKLARDIRASFDALVVLGIGGSALGTIAVHQALGHLHHNELEHGRRTGVRLYVEDNVDPERMEALLDVVDVRRTAFNVISKSGSTSETMAQFLIVMDLLKRELGEGYRRHVTVTTDQGQGTLIRIAKEEGLRTCYVPRGVGGRFSVLSPVGLLPTAAAGTDVGLLLAGARYMDQLCSVQDMMHNPACLLAALQVLSMGKGYNISVMMPYADSLKYCADWYAQLWAESLGKLYDGAGRVVRTGQTPVKALGATDQHSQVQLYVEGPFDKVVTFLRVEQYRAQVTIPGGYDHLPDVAFLSGHTLNELMLAEQRATEYALTKSGHVNNTIILPQVNAFTVGQLIYLLEMATAFAGELLHINAFDQPGVEAGKNAAYALLGRPGYEALGEELRNAPAKQARYIL